MVYKDNIHPRRPARPTTLEISHKNSDLAIHDKYWRVSTIACRCNVSALPVHALLHEHMGTISSVFLSVFVGFRFWFDIRYWESANCLRTSNYWGVILSLESLILRNNISWGCQRTGCWVTYLNLYRKSNSRLENVTHTVFPSL
jgi:hypothetical protein